MGVNTKLGDTLEKNEFEKLYDASCKEVLKDKRILANLLKTCTIEFQDYTISEIATCIEKEPETNVYMNPASVRCEDIHISTETATVTVTNNTEYKSIRGLNTEDTYIPGAKIIYDILFEATVPNSEGGESIGLVVNIEAQNKDNPGYPLLRRAVYYGSRLLARQKNDIIGFKNSDYSHLKKVYSIWIVLNTTKDKENTVNRYDFTETRILGKYSNPKSYYDMLSVVMVYPGKEYNLEDDNHNILEMLSILFSEEMEFSQKKMYLTRDYDIIMSEELEKEVSSMCNFSQGVKERGKQEGIIIGKELERFNSLKSIMKNMNLTFEEAMDILELATSDREKMKNLFSKENQEKMV